MIEGWFDEKYQLRFEIELVDSNNIPIAIDALLDTGSTEWLAMSNQDIMTLGWLMIGRRIVRTVQGEITLNVYAGKVILDGQELEISVLASERLEDYLIGIPWLITRRLVADIREGILTLGDEI